MANGQHVHVSQQLHEGVVMTDLNYSRYVQSLQSVHSLCPSYVTVLTEHFNMTCANVNSRSAGI